MTEFIPPLFKRFGKGLSDLFKEQFEFKKQLKVKNVSANGITVETTGEAVKGDFVGTLKGTHKAAQQTVEVEVSTLGAQNWSVKADKLAKGLTVKVSANERPSAKAEIDYAQEYYSTSLGVGGSSSGANVDGALVLGYDGFAVGGNVEYDVSGQNVSDYNAGAEYSGPSFTTTIKTANQINKVNLTHLHQVDSTLTVGASVSYDVPKSKTVVALGSSYKWDAFLTSKFKVDSDGFVSSAIEQKLPGAKVKALLATEHNAHNLSTVPERFGLGFIFGDD